MNLKKTFLSAFLFLLLITSCQVKKKIDSTKYIDLSSKEKQQVDKYLNEATKLISKKENEIILFMQYNCFFDKNIEVNGAYNIDFPREPKLNHYGDTLLRHKKKSGKIIFKFSDGKVYRISQKQGYDYIWFCYNKELKTLNVHYYDFPKTLKHCDYVP